MTHKLDLYKCNVCGNMVEVVLEGAGTLVCCNAEMELLTPKFEDSLMEKHLPVIEFKENEATIRIGEVAHPMLPEHYIQFVEAISNDNNYLKRKYFAPGDEPVLKFKCKCTDGLAAREFCNIHGLFANDKMSEEKVVD